MKDKTLHNNRLTYGERNLASAYSAVDGQPPSGRITLSGVPVGGDPFERSDPSGKKFKSAGMRIHNEMTYRGVDLALNAACGITFTYWATRSSTGRKWTDFWTNTAKKSFKSVNISDAGAKYFADFVNIMFGGTVTIPPIMYLEHKPAKVAIIKGLDERIYGKDRVDNDPKFQQMYTSILQEPRKGFVAGMATRIIAIAPLIAAASAFPKFLTRNLYDPIGRWSKAAAESMNIKPKALTETTYIDNFGKEINNWDGLHRIIGFDVGLTIFYSILHEWTYKAAAEMFGKRSPIAAPADKTADHTLDEHGHAHSEHHQDEPAQQADTPTPRLAPDSKLSAEQLDYQERIEPVQQQEARI